MNNYVILTDSGCDVGLDVLEKWGVKCVDLTFKEVSETTVYSNRNMPISDFYYRMRDGAFFQTSAVNLDEYEKAFEAVLKEGRDILYIGLSSGLSSTSYTARVAAGEMLAKYRERDVRVIDSLCASAGQGLLLYLAVQKRNEGLPLKDNSDYVRKAARQICHWFTVDDLKYLKRGGRITATAAFAATVLQIKPVLHLDDEGHIVGVSKARGRKNSIKELAEKYMLTAKDTARGTYFISHGDCLEDAEYLEYLISQKCGRKATLISDIGPVIGSHSGPGTLALFYEGSER